MELSVNRHTNYVKFWYFKVQNSIITLTQSHIIYAVKMSQIEIKNTECNAFTKKFFNIHSNKIKTVLSIVWSIHVHKK